MKLAEALLLRADLQKRVSSIRERIQQNARIQEGDTPEEDPQVLFSMLDKSLKKLTAYLSNQQGQSREQDRGREDDYRGAG